MEAAAELAPLLKGEIRADACTRALYSTAACIYRSVPACVVFPAREEDAAETIKFALSSSMNVTARGGGSSVAGQAVGSGIILDFSRRMNRVLRVVPEENFAVVEPGVALDDLNRELAGRGKMFGPDPSSSACATVGGMIANNASGARFAKVGDTAGSVVSLRAVTGSGEIVETSKLPSDLGEKLTAIVEMARRLRPALPAKNSSGYLLFRGGTEGAFNPAVILCGSEGTLAVVTAATLRLRDIPRCKASAFIAFRTVAAACRAIPAIAEARPDSAELVDRGLVAQAFAAVPGLKDLMGNDPAHLLFAEFSGSEPGDIREKAEILCRRFSGEPDVVLSSPFLDAEGQARLWSVRKTSVGILHRRGGRRRPHSIVEDGAVEQDRLEEYWRGVEEILKTENVEAAVYGHALAGHLHIRPYLDLESTDGIEQARGIFRRINDLVLSLGGTMTAEHGDGRLRGPLLRKAFGKAYAEVFLPLKKLFDPAGVLNPGVKIETTDDPFDFPLRGGDTGRRLSCAPAKLAEKAAEEALKCHGCGECRSFCPSYASSRREEDLTRARTGQLREWIRGSLGEGAVSEKDFFKLAAGCLMCERCSWKCPTGVDAAVVTAAVRSAFYEAGRLPLDVRLFSHPHWIAAAGRLLHPISDAVAESTAGRLLIETALGVDRRRQAMKFGGERLKRSYEAKKPAGRKVAFFSGCPAGLFDVEGEGKPAVELLQNLGVEVEAPRFECCGVPALAAGDSRTAFEGARRNAALISGLFSRGYDVVFTSPTCGLALTKLFPLLLGESFPEGRVVELSTYLLGLSQDGIITPPESRRQKVKAAYHVPCHAKALGREQDWVRCLREITGVEVVVLPENCCGLSGSWGMKKANYDHSLQIASVQLAEIAKVGPDVIVSPCSSCRQQLGGLAKIPAVHPVRLIRVMNQDRETRFPQFQVKRKIISH